MKTELKQKIAFAMVMGVFTTGIISFSLISINVGFIERFWQIWLRSWATSYVLVIPAILFLGPKIQELVLRAIPHDAPTDTCTGLEPSIDTCRNNSIPGAHRSELVKPA